MVSFLSVRTPRAAPTNPLMVRRIAAFSGSRKRISHSSRSLRLSPLLEGGKRGERRYLNELLRIVNKRAILTLVVMTFLPFPSSLSLSLFKKVSKIFFLFEGREKTRLVAFSGSQDERKRRRKMRRTDPFYFPTTRKKVVDPRPHLASLFFRKSSMKPSSCQ